MSSPYISAAETAELLAISKSAAYVLIRKINAELEREGFLTLKGKVPRRRLLARMGIEEGAKK